mmetsp:Transcript_36373/g.91866  ORF Transcript_36373/g.91866 Transcript_36373/m.91866 type:complete len:219 (-) Transcript_36373:2-658(-)
MRTMLLALFVAAARCSMSADLPAPGGPSSSSGRPTDSASTAETRLRCTVGVTTRRGAAVDPSEALPLDLLCSSMPQTSTCPSGTARARLAAGEEGSASGALCCHSFPSCSATSRSRHCWATAHSRCSSLLRTCSANCCLPVAPSSRTSARAPTAMYLAPASWRCSSSSHGAQLHWAAAAAPGSNRSSCSSARSTARPSRPCGPAARSIASRGGAACVT